jgi:hypothetical protein
MKMTLDGKLIAKELRQSQKGNTYAAFLMSQGTETLTCMCDDSLFQRYSDIEPLLDYKFTLDYSTRWKSWKIVDCEVF